MRSSKICQICPSWISGRKSGGLLQEEDIKADFRGRLFVLNELKIGHFSDAKSREKKKWSHPLRTYSQKNNRGTVDVYPE